MFDLGAGRDEPVAVAETGSYQSAPFTLKDSDTVDEFYKYLGVGLPKDGEVIEVVRFLRDLRPARARVTGVDPLLPAPDHCHPDRLTLRACSTSPRSQRVALQFLALNEFIELEQTGGEVRIRLGERAERPSKRP